MILPVIYAWLSFRNLSFQEIVIVLSSATALDIFWKVVLLIYYTGWVFGSSIDTNFHEDVASSAPYDGQLPAKAVGLVAVFLVVAILLLYSKTYEQFVIFITVFYLINLVGYSYIVNNFTKPMLRDSIAQYRQSRDFFGIERISIFEHYMLGSWQILRFAVGATIIAAMIGVAVIKFVNQGRVPGLENIPIELLQAAGMLCFVAVMETWIFSMRIRARAGLTALEHLEAKYALQLKSAESRE